MATRPLEVQRIDRELAARRTRYMKELRTSVAELEKRINQCMDDKQVPWRRIEASFNDQQLWIPIKPFGIATGYRI